MRIAEIITVAAIVMAGITIMIDMARPDRLLNLFVQTDEWITKILRVIQRNSLIILGR